MTAKTEPVRAATRAAFVEMMATKSTAEIAADLGVSSEAIRKAVKTGEVGPLISRKLADHLGISVDALVAKHAAPDAPKSAPSRRVLETDRYPSRPGALAALTGAGIDPRLIDIIASMQFKSDDDPGPEYWLTIALREARGLLQLAESAASPDDGSFTPPKLKKKG